MDATLGQPEAKALPQHLRAGKFHNISRFDKETDSAGAIFSIRAIVRARIVFGPFVLTWINWPCGGEISFGIAVLFDLAQLSIPLSGRSVPSATSQLGAFYERSIRQASE